MIVLHATLQIPTGNRQFSLPTTIIMFWLGHMPQLQANVPIAIMAIISAHQILAWVAILPTITNQPTQIMLVHNSQHLAQIAIPKVPGVHLLLTTMDNISQFIQESIKVNGIYVPTAIQIQGTMQFIPVQHPAIHKQQPIASITGLLATNMLALPV